MNLVGDIGEKCGYFYDHVINVAMPIINCNNCKISNTNNSVVDRQIFIKHYDKCGKIVNPTWESSGKNFDVKK